MKSFHSILSGALLALGSAVAAHALVLDVGTATINFDTAAMADHAPYRTIDGVFGLTEDYNTMVSGSLPSIAPSGSVTFDLNFGTSTAPYGRVYESTNLDLNPADILGSWGTSTDTGYFLSLGSGEQIGFGGGVRVTGDYTGILVFGDFALRYSPSRVGGENNLSGLVLTSSAGGFANAVFANVANASISFVNDTLSIEGDLLFAEGAALLAAGFPDVQDFKFGTISLTASAVPEPSSYALIFGTSVFALAFTRRRRR